MRQLLLSRRLIMQNWTICLNLLWLTVTICWLIEASTAPVSCTRCEPELTSCVDFSISPLISTTARVISTRVGPQVIVHLHVDVRDAMGANAVNTMAEALAPSTTRTGVVSDSTLCMTYGEGQPGDKEQHPLQEIAAMETAAGWSLIFNKILPCKGLDCLPPFTADVPTLLGQELNRRL